MFETVARLRLRVLGQHLSEAAPVQAVELQRASRESRPGLGVGDCGGEVAIGSSGSRFSALRLAF
jgi:hypothetical protein